MAERRMFSKSVTMAGRFQRLDNATQLLYFHMGMMADDDGVAEGYTVAKMLGLDVAALDQLAEAGLVRVLNPDYVCVISDWTTNNQVRKDRYTPSAYADLLAPRASAASNDGGDPPSGCGLVNQVCHAVGHDSGNPGLENGGDPPSGCGLATEVRLGKDSIGEEEKKEVLRTSKENEEESKAPVFSKIILQNGIWGDIPESYVLEAEGAYSGVDVREEIRKACLWCQSNPKGRKRDWRRFITNWLSRASSEAKARAGTAAVGYGQTVHGDRIPSGRYDDVEDIDFSGGGS